VQRQGDSEVYVLATLQGAERGGADSWRAAAMQPWIHLRYILRKYSQLPFLQIWLQWNGVEGSTLHQIHN